LEDPATRDETLVALGSKFSDLDLEAMKTVVVQTDFYETPTLGKALFGGNALPAVMERVVSFCTSQQILERPVSYGFGPGEAVDLRFDSTRMDCAAAQR
jgi:hypothetical protein